MDSKLKLLGPALLAAFTVAMVIASSATAQFTSDKEHTIFSGSQEGSHVVTMGEGFGGVTCSSSSVSGTSASKSASSLVLTPLATGCKDSFGRSVDGATGNGISLTFTVNGTVHASGSLTAKITSGGSVVCTVSFIFPQTNNGISYDNLSGTNGIRVTTNMTNVKSTTSGGFFGCGISDGQHNEGTYAGTTVLTGKDTENSPAAISVD